MPRTRSVVFTTLLVVFFGAYAIATAASWLQVPFVRQVRAGCGSAAVAMVMQYWALQEPRLDTAAADAERIDKLLPAPSAKGIPGRLLKQYLEEHGFSAFVFNGEPRDLEHHLEKGRPLVVCLGLNGPRAPLHYVVVVGMDDKAAVLNDPARGKLVREDLSRFLAAWKVTGNWALLAVPQQRP